MSRMVHGAIGLAKAALGIGLAPEGVIQARRDVCRECPLATRSTDPRFAAAKGLTSFSVCQGGCGCVIAAKTRLKGERCPLGKWEAWIVGSSNGSSTAV